MRISKKFKAITSGVLAGLAVIGISAVAHAGYLPSSRPTYQCITPTNCPGADHVVFNSFTNAPNYGDERPFLDGKDATNTSAGGYLDNIPVQNGQKIVIRTYIHNNANPAAIGEAAATAHNTQLQVMLPTGKRTTQVAGATISASNASPQAVSDTVSFTGAQPFSLKFDPSSPVQVTYRPNGTGNYVTNTLPSASFSNDVTMNANIGDWKGCFEYSALVTMVVVVQMDTPPPVTPSYACSLLDIVATENRTVRISRFDTSESGGATFSNAVISWGDGSGNLSSPNPVNQTHTYGQDGTYTINATAYFTVDGSQVSATSASCSRQVTFSPNVPPVVPPVTPPVTPAGTTPRSLPQTGPGSVVGIFLAVTSVGSLGYYFITRRIFGL